MSPSIPGKFHCHSLRRRSRRKANMTASCLMNRRFMSFYRFYVVLSRRKMEHKYLCIAVTQFSSDEVKHLLLIARRYDSMISNSGRLDHRLE